MKLSTYAKRIGIQYKTAWLHYNKGLIEGAYQLPTGTIIVPDNVLDAPKDYKGEIQAKKDGTQEREDS